MPTRMDWIAGLRRLRRKPLYTLTVALALGIGVGAVTIVFSWFEGLFLRPLPGVEDARRLTVFELRRPDYSTTAFSYPDYQDIASALAPLMDVASYSMARVTLTGDSKPEQHWALFVSPNFFSTLQLRGSVGRLPGAANSSAEATAVISYDWWQARFRGDPSIVGQVLYLNRRAVRIVGIGPRDFQGPLTGLSLGLYLPASLSDWIDGGQPKLANRSARSFALLGRLRPGGSLKQATEASRLVARRLDRAYPKSTFEGADIALVEFWKSPAGAQSILGPVMIALGGIVAMVLLLACSNASGVMLLENSLRRRDIAIRVSLGAGSTGLIRHCLAESILLSLLAAGAGLFIASLAAGHLQDLAPALPFPVKLRFGIDTPVLFFSMAASAIAAGFCGMWGGLEAFWHSSLVRPSQDRSRMRGVFVCGQIALSFLLLSASALVYRSVEQQRSLNLGFDARSVWLERVDLKGSGLTSAQGAALLETALSRVRQQTGVESAAFARSVPFGLGDQEQVALRMDGDAEPRSVRVNRLSPDYFATLGIGLRAGRDFNSLDRPAASPVAIVNEVLGRELWQAVSPLGRSFSIEGRRYLVVGVAANTKIWSLGQDAQPCLYLPLWQSDAGSAVLHVKSKLGVGAVRQMVEGELERLDSSLPLEAGRSMTEQLDSAVFPLRVALLVMAIFSLTGIYLAGMGVYGVIALSAQSRSKEMAIRMALGATAMDVCGTIAMQLGRVLVPGLVVGLVLSAAASLLLQSLLTGIHGIDPASMAVTAALVAFVSLLAAIWPAWRAVHVQPALALRGE